MVRKIIVVLLALTALAALPLGVSAADVYDGNISSTYITIFQDIVGKISPLDDYVFYRSGQYEYTMIVGDIQWDGAFFAADEAVSYKLYNTTGTGVGYQYFSDSVVDWELYPGSALLYSNLADYPALVDQSAVYSFASLHLLLVAVFMYLIRSIFSFTLRRR